MTRSAPPEPFQHSNKPVCLTPTGEGAPRRIGGVGGLKYWHPTAVRWWVWAKPKNVNCGERRECKATAAISDRIESNPKAPHANRGVVIAKIKNERILLPGCCVKKERWMYKASAFFVAVICIGIDICV